MEKQSVANTLMAPTIDPDDLKHAFADLDAEQRQTAPANRIEAGVPRHTWYKDRFTQPKNTPFQS